MITRKTRPWYLSGVSFILASLLTYALWQRVPPERDSYRVSGRQDGGLVDLFRNPTSSPKLRSYELTITSGYAAPDGVRRPMLLINGGYPGPLIEGTVGDLIRVRVVNRLPSNTSAWDALYRELFSSRVDKYLPPGAESHVSLHWHGLSMRGTPEMDGAPGFTSRSIPPGAEATYEFRLHGEDAGSHWYHSHVGMQRSDGLFGPLVVHPAVDHSEDGNHSLEAAHIQDVYDDQILLLGDHYHTPGIDQLAWFLSRHSLGFEPTPDSILINGKGTFDCATALRSEVKDNCDASAGSHAEITLTPEKTSRLRLVNVGAVGHTTFSIDEHMLEVVEADGTPIVPFTTTRLSVAPGQRYSVLVKGKSDDRPVWIRASMDRECFNNVNPTFEYEGRAIARYANAEDKTDLRRERLRPRIARDTLPTTTAWAVGSEGDGKAFEPCHDMPMSLLRPLSPASIPGDEGNWLRTMVTLTMPKLDRNDLVPVSYVNRTSWSHDDSGITLLEAFRSADVSALAHPAFPADPYEDMPKGDGLPYDPSSQMVLHAPVGPSAGDSPWIELVINNSDEAPHPFHLHGHKFIVLESSESTFGWGAYANEEDEQGDVREYGPVIRDTFSIPRRGYAKIAWKMDNPGVWALHCHVLVHMASGMALAVVDHPERLIDSR